MATYLVIAGHGWQRDGTFDPGAKGYITKGEYKFMVEDLFPAMKKYLPKDANVIFYTEKKVSNHGNLTQIAKQYKADAVIEFHFDAHTLGSSARGGHVIVHSSFAPDKMDLAIRDVIKSMVGVRYNHKGKEGISGRNNLYNVNMAANNGINYRLVELGFGTNKTDSDIMVKNVDEYAKKLVEAIVGNANGKPTTSKPTTPSKPNKPNKPSKKTTEQLAKEVINGDWGDGNERKSALTKAGYNYSAIQKEVNKILGGGSTTTNKPSTSKPASKTVKVGSKVKIKSSAKNYSRTTTAIPAKHKNKSYTVQQVAKNDVLIKELYSWVKKSDLVGVSTSTSKPSTSKPKANIKQLADKIINSKTAPTGNEARRKWLGVDKATYDKVRAEINRRFK